MCIKPAIVPLSFGDAGSWLHVILPVAKRAFGGSLPCLPQPLFPHQPPRHVHSSSWLPLVGIGHQAGLDLLPLPDRRQRQPQGGANPPLMDAGTPQPIGTS